MITFIVCIKLTECAGSTAHLKPNPAGTSTADANSNSEPIQYIVSYYSIKGCADENLEKAK